MHNPFSNALGALIISLAFPFSSAFAQNISIANVTLTEADTGTVNFDFPITINPPAAAAINLTYSTGVAGTATSGTDFVPVAAGTISIPVGATSAIARVLVNNDLIVETQETFTTTIALAPGSPGTMVTAQALGQISNDDNSVLSMASVAQAEGNAAGALSFTASLSRPVQGAISITVTSSDDSAVAPGDYAAVNQTLNFASGVTSAPLSVASAGELIVEANERFALNLSGLITPPLLAGSITASTAPIFGTLNNDDSTIVSVTAPSQLEGNAGTAAMLFSFSLSAPVQGGLSVNASTSDGTATLANGDYQPSSSNVFFSSLSTAAQTATVAINGDLTVEPDENFALNLTGLTLPTGITASSVTLPASSTGTIRNDDATSLSIAAAAQPEGNVGTSNLAFSVSLTAPSATAISVNFATAPGTAVATDFTAAVGSITLNPGQTSQTINVAILGDTILEPDESFSLSLSNPVGATLGTGVALGTIQNDDSVNLGISSVRAPEANSPFNFVVSLTGASAVPISVQFTMVDGTAQAPTDYTATAGTLNFAPGETSKTISVAINPDTLVENAETFNVVLSNTNLLPPLVTLNPAIGVGTIDNDDAFIQVPGLNALGMLLLGLLMLVLALRAVDGS